jgi:hypothetical protein
LLTFLFQNIHKIKWHYIWYQFFYFNTLFSQIITTRRIRHTKCVIPPMKVLSSYILKKIRSILKKIRSIKISVSSSKFEQDTSTLFTPKFSYIFEFFIFIYFEQIYCGQTHHKISYLFLKYIWVCKDLTNDLAFSIMQK